MRHRIRDIGWLGRLLLRRCDDNTRTLATRQRKGEDLPESVLVLDARQEPRVEGTRADYDAKEAAKRVLAWLNTQSEPVTRQAVEEAVEGRAELVRAALYTLVDDEQVTRTGAGKRGDPHLYGIPVRLSQHIPGHADTNQKTGTSSPDSATLACPADRGSDAPPDTLRDTLSAGRSCPKGHAMRHRTGLPPDQGWVCATCYPEAAAVLGLA